MPNMRALRIMRTKGFIGLFMLCLFTAAMALLLRAGGNWAVTARVMIAVLGFVLGWNGIQKLIQACGHKGNTCYLCGTKATRYCDFQMQGGGCGRYACHLHLHVSTDGKRDYCEDHENLPRLP